MKNRPFDIKVLMLGIIFSVLIAGVQIYEHKKIEDAQTRNIGIILANKIKAKMEVLEDVTQLLKEVSIARNGNLSQEDFYKVSRHLYSLYKESGITGIFYLKGGKIEYIYPIERNVGTLGIDIFKQEDRKGDALLAVEKKQTVVSGPYDLYQGGKGLIIRNPIFIKENNKEKFIGFSAIAVRFPEFIDSINLGEIHDYNYRISSVSNGERKVIITTNNKINSPKIFTMEIYNNRWEIALESFELLEGLENILIVFLSLFILTLILSNLSYRYKEKRTLLEEIELEKELLIVALENSNMVIFTYDDETKKIIFRNKRYFIEEYDNYMEIYPNMLEERLVIEEGKEKLIEIFSMIKGGRKSVSCVVKKKNEKYGYIWEKITLLNPFVDKYGMRKIIGVIENITDSKEKEIKLEKERHYKNAVKEGSIFYLEANITTNTLSLVNKENFEDNKLEYDKFIKKYIDNNVYKEDRKWVKQSLNLEICNKKYFEYGTNSFSMEYRHYYQNRYIWVRSNIYLSITPKTNELNIVIVTRNIDEEKEKELVLINQAERDMLTGLYNREAVKNRIDEFFLNGKKSGAFFILDLDNFKSINDNYGHHYGDIVLKDTAKILLNSFRDEDLIGRLGGDEFIVFMKDVKSSEIIERKAEILKESLRRVYREQGKKIEISALIGIVAIFNSKKDFESLYLAADKVMYDVKNNNKNGYKIVANF